MKRARLSSSAVGPKAKFKVRKEPFGLSLSKPACGTTASASSALPFDKLRANGFGKLTVTSGRSGPKAHAHFMRRVTRSAMDH
jgi:hypothetical protein